MSWDKAKVNIGQDRLDLGEVNLLPIKIDLNCEKIKLFPLSMDSQVQLHSFIPDFSTLSYQSNAEGKGNGCCPQSVRLAIYSSIILKNFPCFSMFISHGLQSFSTNVL